MVPWVLFPNKPISSKLSPSEEKDEADSIGLHYLESTIDVASGRIACSVPVTSQALPSAALLLNTLGSVSDWESLVSVDVLFSKSHRRGVTQDDKLTWQLLISPASSLPWKIKSALFPTKCSGCRAAHHLHLLDWRGKRCRGSGQQKQLSNCTLGCPVLGWLFFFPWEDLTKLNPISSKYQTGSYT